MGCGSEYSFKLAEGNKMRFSAGEVTEAIFNHEDFGCGSHIELCPDSENEENSDIDISEQLQRLEIKRQQHEAIAIGIVSCIYWKKW